MRHLWKVFRWCFLSRHRLSFRWHFVSKQGMRALMNPRVNRRSGFVDNFWVGSGSVFVYYFWIKRGCVLSRIQASPVEGFSLKISESAPTPFSLTFSKSTGDGGTEESTRHLWNRFLWRFQRRQWLNFHWLFLSQHGMGALTNPRVTVGSSFVDDFPVGIDLVVVDFFFVNRGCESFRFHASPLEGVLVMISELAATQFFVDYFWLNRGCARCRIHASPLESVLLTISETTKAMFHS